MSKNRGDGVSTPDATSGAEEPQPRRVSRRAMLQAGTVGAVAVGTIGAFPGVLTGLGGAAFASPGSPELGSPELDTPADQGPIVAHVKDASTGEVSLFVGEREITYQDRALVRHLTRAAR